MNPSTLLDFFALLLSSPSVPPNRPCRPLRSLRTLQHVSARLYLASSKLLLTFGVYLSHELPSSTRHPLFVSTSLAPLSGSSRKTLRALHRCPGDPRDARFARPEGSAGGGGGGGSLFSRSLFILLSEPDTARESSGYITSSYIAFSPADIELPREFRLFAPNPTTSSRSPRLRRYPAFPTPKVGLSRSAGTPVLHRRPSRRPNPLSSLPQSQLYTRRLMNTVIANEVRVRYSLPPAGCETGTKVCALSVILETDELGHSRAGEAERRDCQCARAEGGRARAGAHRRLQRVGLFTVPESTWIPYL